MLINQKNNRVIVKDEIIKENLEFIYTTFDYPDGNFTPIQINLKEANLDFVKLYYRDKIKFYFKKLPKIIVENGFIDDIEIWQRKLTQYHEF